MNGRVLLPLLLLLLTPLAGSAAEVSIRIFARTRPTAVIITAEKGSYRLSHDSGDELLLATGEIVVMKQYGERVIYSTLSGSRGAADSLILTPASADALCSLRAPDGDGQRRRLSGTVTVSAFPGSLMILNITGAEELLPGIVRAEAGRLGPADYFRAQAVVARTYLYRNIDRHALDGYNLCDDVHCQVYPGVVTDSVIVNACRSTAGMVLTDRDSMLIEAAFHGNCGGETASSAAVWLAGYPYLVSIKDPWCSYSPSSVWRASAPLSEWNAFLRSKGVTPGTEEALYGSGTAGGRIYSYRAGGKTITGEEIRVRFGLRSAWFTMRPAGDSLIFDGRGYGHGVGLCQDGARHMAEKGISYDRITGFYYPGTIITDIKNAHRPVRP